MEKGSKSICPLKVKEAYDRLGVEPRQGIFISANTRLACGLGVLALDANGRQVWTGTQVESFITEQYGVSDDYICGFERGFDGTIVSENIFSKPDFKAGYEAGELAYKLSSERKDP